MNKNTNINLDLSIGMNFDELIQNKNKLIDEIFNYVKLKKWDDLLNFILLNIDTIDLNIKDNSNISLLEYAVIFNQSKLLDVLLNNNVHIDIVDDSSKSILYNVIKFSYTDILVKLLEKNKSAIGRSILEISDKDGNIPLFYSIQFYNIECLKIILKYTTNFYIKNQDGENCLHIAIKTQNNEIFNLVSSYFNNIGLKNNIGESILHLMVKFKCYEMLNNFIEKNHTNGKFIELLNMTEYKYNFTILHYISIGMDWKYFEIFEKFNLIQKFNGDIQDNSGNIFFHYIINRIYELKNCDSIVKENLFKVIDYIEKIKFNINIYNIDGNTSSHLFFSNFDFFYQNHMNNLINYMIEKTDLNIQNFKGESVFFFMIKYDYWKLIKNLLSAKKIDIFVVTNNFEIIFDYLKQDDFNEFIELVTLSYLYQLKKNNTTIKWLDYWDNRCKKIVKSNELNDTEKELLKNYNIFLNRNNNLMEPIEPTKSTKQTDINICGMIVKNKITTAINTFIDNKYNIDSIVEYTSYPVSRKFTKLISSYPQVVVSTFSGSSIDILSGLIYLSNKFNKIKKNILTSLMLFNDYSNTIECYTPKKKILATGTGTASSLNNKKICDIEGFEILWINKNIFFPQNSKYDIINLIKQIDKKKINIEWFIIPIGIELYNNAHANYLIINLTTKEIERFEPHGAQCPVGLNYDSELLDSKLIDYFSELDNYKYFKPSEYLAKIGFQQIEITESKNDYIGDPNGFCALWCIWWADMRISNPNISRTKLFKYLLKEIIKHKYSLKKLIRNFSQYIIEIRDKLFLKANTNINEWINDIISDDNIILLNSSINEILTNITNEII